jgi:glycerol-3-phosphate acyltransferase PlsY
VTAVVIALAYAIGCVSPGHLLVRRATGADLRGLHTGSTGARNAARVAGWRLAAAVFLLDLLKGMLAVGLAVAAGLSDRGAAACLVAVVAGHVAPLQLRFRGGRGLSTGLGGALVLAPLAAGLGLVAAVVTVAIVRSFTVAGMVGAAAVPVAALATGSTGAVTVGLAVAAALIVAAHARSAGARAAISRSPR